MASRVISGQHGYKVCFFLYQRHDFQKNNVHCQIKETSSMESTSTKMTGSRVRSQKIKTRLSRKILILPHKFIASVLIAKTTENLNVLTFTRSAADKQSKQTNEWPHSNC